MGTTFLVASVAAYQVYDAVSAQEAATEQALRAYARFAGWSFAREAGLELQRGIRVALAPVHDAGRADEGPLPEIGGVSVRDDLCALLRPVGQNTSMIRSSSVLPCLIPELRRSPHLHQVYQRIIEPRRELMRGVFRRGIASGELRADLDIEVVMAMLVGPLLAQSVVNWNPDLDRATLPERLVDAIWPAIAAHP